MTCVSDRSPPKARPTLRLIVLAVTASLAFLAGATVTARAQKHPSTAVIVDEEAKAVRIVIDGKDVAVISAAGVSVSGDITYSGTLADTGGAP